MDSLLRIEIETAEQIPGECIVAMSRQDRLEQRLRRGEIAFQPQDVGELSGSELFDDLRRNAAAILGLALVRQQSEQRGLGLTEPIELIQAIGPQVQQVLA